MRAGVTTIIITVPEARTILLAGPGPANPGKDHFQWVITAQTPPSK